MREVFEINNGKIDRVLSIYTKLINGYSINKAEESANFGVNERSIQRDIDDIRNYMKSDDEQHSSDNSIIYDRSEKVYRLEKSYNPKFSNSEVLAICKILLDSRAFTKKEMTDMLDKLIAGCVPKKNQKQVKELISNEEFHYVQLRHKTSFIDNMWEIGQAIRNCSYVEIEYYRIKDKSIIKRKLKPAAIMFSEYYFYLTAFIEDEKVRQGFDVIDDAFPTIYRIDRIRKIKVLEEKFRIPYSSRFQEGEFRKRIQFMYGGKIHKVKFEYKGPDIDAILDRLPTAVIEKEENGVFTINAEVFGKGIDMWLRSQGDLIELK